MTIRADLVRPTTHLNGTAPEELTQQYVAAAQAVRDAIEAHSRAWPNGRDYYPQGPEAAQRAQDQAEDRRRKLAEVLEELEELAFGV